MVHILSIRRQPSVSTNESNSSLTEIICGVSQGTVMGPLFSLLKLMICQLFQKVKFYLSANDLIYFLFLQFTLLQQRKVRQ